MTLFNFQDVFFIAIYGIAFIASMIAALMLRWYLRKPGHKAADDRLDLDPYEIAYLTGGEWLAINGAIASLVAREVLAVLPVERRLSLGSEPLPFDAHPLERIIYDTVASQPEQTLREVRRRAVPAIALLSLQLQERGLLVAGRAAWKARFLPLALVLLAIAPLLVGLWQGGGERMFVLAWSAPVVAALAAFARRPHRSRRGDRVVARFKEEIAPLHYTAMRRPGALAGADLALVVGLYGTDVLAEPLAAALAGRARGNERVVAR